MPMQLKCPNPACTTMLNVREEFAGKMIKCPTCAATLMVPQPAAAAAMAAAPVTPAMPVAMPMPSPGMGAASGTPIPPEMQGPTASPMETFWALIDKNNLDKKSQMLLAAGIGAMLFLLFSMILPRFTVTYSGEMMGVATTRPPNRMWWIETVTGAFIILGTLMDLALIAACFAKMHVFLRYSFFAAAAWGGLTFVSLFFTLIADAFAGSDVMGMKVDVSIGVGTYFGILATLGIVGCFGLLSYPEVMKLVKQHTAKPGVPS